MDQTTVLLSVLAISFPCVAGIAEMRWPKSTFAGILFLISSLVTLGCLIGLAYLNWPKNIASIPPMLIIVTGLALAAVGVILQLRQVPGNPNGAPMTIDGLDSLGGIPTSPAVEPLPRTKAGLTARHQSDVLYAIEKFRAWLNGPVLEVYKTGDGIFMEQSNGLKDFKSTLANYRKTVVEMGKTSETMQREYEYAPEVLGLSNWYFADAYQTTSDLMNEIDRVLSKYDDNKEHLQNNLLYDRFRRTSDKFRLWIIENKEKLMTLKKEYEAYEVGAE